VRPEPVRVQPAGGRRRAPEPPPRQEPVHPEPVRPEPVVERSRHAVEPGPEPEVARDHQPYRDRHRNDETEAETTGAHAAGRSVTELLAAHTNADDDAPRRHRRRAD
jgi:hypothetical protein